MLPNDGFISMVHGSPYVIQEIMPQGRRGMLEYDEQTINDNDSVFFGERVSRLREEIWLVTYDLHPIFSQPSGGIGDNPPSDQSARAPKIAVPMRTMVAPSSMAISKSWLIPMERCLISTFWICIAETRSASSLNRRK